MVTTRGGRVAPSIIRSETFLFALVVLALGVIVPYYTRPGESGHPAYQNSTVVPVAVVPPASSPSQSSSSLRSRSNNNNNQFSNRQSNMQHHLPHSCKIHLRQPSLNPLQLHLHLSPTSFLYSHRRRKQSSDSQSTSQYICIPSYKPRSSVH